MPASTPLLAPNRTFAAIAPAVGAFIALVLMAIAVARHPAALEGNGARLFCLDIGLLLAYAVASLWMLRQKNAELHAAIGIGAIAGVVLGVVLVANHVSELFLLHRSFPLVITPVLLALALFAAAGSAARERAGSSLMAIAAGLWCAIVGVLLLLCVGLALTFFLQAQIELWLHQAFVASGNSDPAGFVVQNTLQAASEGLMRLPIAAVLVSLFGATSSAWIVRRPRPVLFGLFFAALLGFIAGVAALSHANALARNARPPWIGVGLFLVCFALSTLHPAWSALRRRALPA